MLTRDRKTHTETMAKTLSPTFRLSAGDDKLRFKSLFILFVVSLPFTIMIIIHTKLVANKKLI